MEMIITIVVSFLLTVVIGRWLIPALHALKAGQSIREIGPSWHNAKAGTPTMGGIMFMVPVILCVAVGSFFVKGGHTQWMVLCFSLVFGLIGFADDFVKIKLKRNLGLTALQKFLLQLAVALAYLALLRWDGSLSNVLTVPFTDIGLEIPWVLYLIFATFVIVGCVNAVNLTDGVDGLATGVTMPVMVFFLVVSVLNKSGALMLFPAALLGGLAGFLCYNFHPARVFMGDTGSLFLGGAVCGMAFALDMPLILVLVGIVYIAEALSVIMQVAYFKATHGKRIFRMTPIHHHFEMGGWSEKKIFTVFTGVTALMCVIAYLAL